MLCTVPPRASNQYEWCCRYSYRACWPPWPSPSGATWPPHSSSPWLSSCSPVGGSRATGPRNRPHGSIADGRHLTWISCAHTCAYTCTLPHAPPPAPQPAGAAGSGTTRGCSRCIWDRRFPPARLVDFARLMQARCHYIPGWEIMWHCHKLCCFCW